MEFESPINSPEGKKLTRKFGFNFLKLRIQSSHKRINYCKTALEEFSTQLSSLLSKKLFESVITYSKNKNLSLTQQLKSHHNSSFEKLEGSVDKLKLVNNLNKEKWVINLSKEKFSKKQMDVLRLGLNFATVPTHIPTQNILASVESCLWKVPQSEANAIRSKIMATIQTAKPPMSSLTKEEKVALAEIKNLDTVLFLKADKGNSTIIMDKEQYNEKIETMLSDSVTYVKLKSDPTRKTELELNKFISSLHKKKKIDSQQSFALKSSNATAPRLYGLPKIHKPGIPLRPIVSFVGSPTYNLSKFLANILSPLIGNTEQHVQNSLRFLEDLKNYSIDDDESMVSFDVISLFTNVPIKLALEIAERRLKLFDTDHLSSFSKLSINEICTGLNLCLKATYFIYNNQYYKQIYGTAMGSPVSMIIANLVMEELEAKALSTFQNPPKLWKRYVDDTFVITKTNLIPEFLNHINNIVPTIKFTMETENNNELVFLDLTITRLNTKSFSSKIYRKPTHSGRYLNFKSDHPMQHKRAVVDTLFHRAKTLITDPNEAKKEIQLIKSQLRQNSYPIAFLNKRKKKKNLDNNQSQNECKGLVVLPYVPELSDKIKRILHSHNIKSTFKPPQKISSILPSPKDPIDPNKRKGAIYEIPCNDCDLVYVGETGRSFNTRKKEHQADVKKEQKTLPGTHRTALSKHAITQNHTFNWNQSKLLQFETNYHKRKFIESFFINNNPKSMNDKKSVLFPNVYLR